MLDWSNLIKIVRVRNCACAKHSESCQCDDWSLWFVFYGRYRLEAVQLIQILFVILALLGGTTLYYHHRFCRLEAHSDSIRDELTKLREEVRLLYLANHPEVPNTTDVIDGSEDSEYEGSDEAVPGATDGLHHLRRSKRDAWRNESELNVSELSVNSSMGTLNLTEIVGNSSREERSRRIRGPNPRERGKRMNVRGFSGKNRLKKLKAKLEKCRQKCKTLLLHLSSSNAANLNEPQAAYIIPTGPDVDITKNRQLIGPWYIPPNGDDYGFSNSWYNGLSLDSNKTSIIFQESGLYLIYAQVYYHITLEGNAKPLPMGYRINLRKNEQNRIFRRPIHLAECVPSYPSTYYQTCFTQVAWHVDAGDQIYLEHFAKSFPMIEANSQGKTFVGVVKLSNAR